MEPTEPGYSIFKGTKPEPKIVYELPDGTTTIWLSEYIEAMVQAEQDRIIKLLLETPEGRDAIELALHPSDEGSSLVALIKGSNE